MHLSVYEQSEVFYYAFIVGIGLGLYYDFYRFLRYIGLCSKSEMIAQDIIFMSTASLVCFLFAELMVNGHFRFFIMFAHLLGGISYRYSIGLLSGKFFQILGRILQWLNKLAEKAFEKTADIVNNAFGIISHIWREIFGKFANKNIQ